MEQQTSTRSCTIYMHILCKCFFATIIINLFAGLFKETGKAEASLLFGSHPRTASQHKMSGSADKVAAILCHHARHQEGEAAIQVHDLPLTTLQHKTACRVLCRVGCQQLDKQRSGN